METLDIIISVGVLALVLKLVVDKFKSHPSDKYHNDSWKQARKKKSNKL